MLFRSARAGLLGSDEMIADHLRRLNKETYLVVNKVDGLHEDAATAEFHRLGFSRVYQTSASHGRGVLQLITDILAPFPEDSIELSVEETGVKIAIVGRPNVGKSTLVNRLLGEDRVIVYDMPGTTRDSIYIPYERQGKKYTLIDTAGVRKRGRVHETVEKFSVIKTLQAIKDAHVVVIVFDAREGIVEQDLHMLGFALESGRAVVLAINKWDNMTEYDRGLVKAAIQRRLDFVPYVKIHLISALHGTGVGDLYPSIHRAFESAMIKVPTNRLTQILQDAVEGHQPPLVHGRRIKLRYAHMGGQNPPIIVIHGNQTESVSKDYKRYLENIFRKVLKLQGTPVQLEFKTGDNPFKEDKAMLKPAEIEKRKHFAPEKKRDRR